MNGDVVANSVLRADGRLVRFFKRQVKELSEKGLSALLRKGREFLLMILAVPIVLAVRAVRPWKLIRFGQLASDRIGHFAGNTELYLCERDAGLQSDRSFDVFYHTPQISNMQLKIMWDRTLRVSRFVRVVDRLNRMLPWGGRHIVPIPRDWDIHGLLPCTRVHLSFTSEEEEWGRRGIHALGIPEGVEFVCFSARSSSYLDAMFPTRDWRYHDYRDSSIHSRIPAAEELARRGYYAIRMGAHVKETLATKNPRIIDYASTSRTEFLDIYLGAKCRFFLGDTAGIFTISKIFRRPIVGVNIIPFSHAVAFGRGDLFIPKKLWMKEERRLRTFRELFACGADEWTHSHRFSQAGIEILDNTADEILAVVKEMCDRLDGTWVPEHDDEELQERYWALYPPGHPDYMSPSRPRLGAQFLRENRALLE